MRRNFAVTSLSDEIEKTIINYVKVTVFFFISKIMNEL